MFCFQLSDSEEDYVFSVQFTKNSLGLGFTITSYIGDLNAGNYHRLKVIVCQIYI